MDDNDLDDETVAAKQRLFLGFTWREWLGWDLVLAILGCAGAVVLVSSGGGSRLLDTAPIVVGVAGVAVGSVVAAAALIASFMGPQFLGNIEALEIHPSRYVRPFVATAAFGVIGLVFGLILSVLGPSTSDVWLMLIGGGMALFVVWALASLVLGLRMLLQYVDLQAVSASLMDE